MPKGPDVDRLCRAVRRLEGEVLPDGRTVVNDDTLHEVQTAAVDVIQQLRHERWNSQRAIAKKAIP